MKKRLLLFLIPFGLILTALKVDHHRWNIKTKPAHKTNIHNEDLKDIIKFPDPEGVSMNDSRYENKLIPAFENPLHLKEGDLIKVKGYIHLVAFEKEDDEYHIQISSSKTDGDNCLIVEVPDPKNTDDSELKKNYENVRSFIRERLLHGKEPSRSGNLIGGRAYVYVTGQLFYDAAHSHNQIRGKKGMRSNCLWEIHPIIDMNFAVKPLN